MFRAWCKNFINLIYPLSCLICKVKLTPSSNNPLCQACWDKIESILPPFCRICGKGLPSFAKASEGKPSMPKARQAGLPANSQNQALSCKDCQRSAYFFRTARAVCIYDGIIKECIHLFKYKTKLSLVESLSKLMINFAHNFLNMKSMDLIIPVPLHRVKQRQRQFNQATLLAKPLAETFSKKLQDNLLIKVEAGACQVNLSRAERLKNVRGSFKVKDANRLENKNILLVDDVLTTHATANECARILLEAGANCIDVFALARSSQENRF